MVKAPFSVYNQHTEAFYLAVYGMYILYNHSRHFAHIFTMKIQNIIMKTRNDMQAQGTVS